MDNDKETQTQTKKSSLNPIVGIGIGCLVFIVIVGIILSLAGRFLMGRLGRSAIQSAIEKKTGVKTNLQDLEQGKLSFTDTKTGETVDIGSNKLPDTFPKDFPQYPGAKVVSSLSGSKAGSTNGAWVMFSTKDQADRVVVFYTNSLKSGGWTTDSTTNMGNATTMTVTKGNLTGSLVISADSEKKETGIVVTLGTKQ